MAKEETEVDGYFFTMDGKDFGPFATEEIAQAKLKEYITLFLYTITTERAIEVLINFNQFRKGEVDELISTNVELGKAIDCAVEIMKEKTTIEIK